MLSKSYLGQTVKKRVQDEKNNITNKSMKRIHGISVCLALLEYDKLGRFIACLLKLYNTKSQSNTYSLPHIKSYWQKQLYIYTENY